MYFLIAVLWWPDRYECRQNIVNSKTDRDRCQLVSCMLAAMQSCLFVFVLQEPSNQESIPLYIDKRDTWSYKDEGTELFHEIHVPTPSKLGSDCAGASLRQRPPVGWLRY